MKKKTTLKKFKQPQSVVDIKFLLHRIVSTMEKINRDGRTSEEIVYMLHNDIELIIK